MDEVGGPAAVALRALAVLHWEVPQARARPVVSATLDDDAARVVVLVLVCHLPDTANQVEHAERGRTYIVMADIVMAYTVMADVVMAYIVMADIVMVYAVMAYTVMAYIVMADIVMAHEVMAYAVMACMVIAS